MNSEKKTPEKLTFKELLKKYNIGLLLISLCFAIILWALVIANENPYRNKTLTVSSISFDGEADLIARGLCIRGDRGSDIGYTVRVRAQVSNYASLSNDRLQASASLRNINEAGTYQLPVTASVSGGIATVQSVFPDTITVEIDTLATKTIPVTVNYTGTLPDGYWADLDNREETQRVDIQGPKTDIEKITRATVDISLDDVTESIYSTFNLTFYYEDGSVVSEDVIVGTVPSATVRLNIYPAKEVPINAESALAGVQQMSSAFEISECYSTPETVLVAGEQKVLDSIESLSLEPVSVASLTSTEVLQTSIILPEGAMLPDSNGTVNVTVEVVELIEDKQFDQIKVNVVNVGDGLQISDMEYQNLDIVLTGRVTLLSALSRGDIVIQLDVSGLEAGTYTITPYVFIRDEETTAELSWKLFSGETELTQITVTLK